jgi:SpoVK/Ycf46/Vps4 family AAA+-type ATPase
MENPEDTQEIQAPYIEKDDLAFYNGEIRDFLGKKIAVSMMPFSLKSLEGVEGKEVWSELTRQAVIHLRDITEELPSNAKPQDYERVGAASYIGYQGILNIADRVSSKEEEPEVEVEVFDNAFDKIVLPKGFKEKIIEVTSQLKDGKKIFEEWGLNEKIKKGRGVNLLFSGESGTGKTYCGEIIADYLGTKAEIISVSDIEDKYVGQSERNVSGIFKKLKGGSVVLILDEVDSWLSSRSGSKQHHENKLTNQFLIELERHNGIVVMTTNRPVKLDKALQRRIDLNMNFPFPDVSARKKIWEYIIPEKMPKDGDIDFSKVALFKLNGGNIKNALLTAARKMVISNSKLSTDLLVKSIQEEMSEIDQVANSKDHS